MAAGNTNRAELESVNRRRPIVCLFVAASSAAVFAVGPSRSTDQRAVAAAAPTHADARPVAAAPSAAVPRFVAARTTVPRSGRLPTYEYKAPPNNWDPCEGKNSGNWYSGSYRHFTSAVTPWTGPNGRDKGRVLNFTGSAGRTWWLLASVQVLNGGVGRIFNMHDVAGDTYWGGVSPWAIDHGASGLVLTLEAENRDGRTGVHAIVPASDFRYGKRYDLAIRIVFGRKAASNQAARGATTIWVNGSDKPSVDLRNVSTVYPDQHWLQFWEGAYYALSTRLSDVGKLRASATRFGRTLAEAVRDGTSAQPIRDLGVVGCDSVYKRGSGLSEHGDSQSTSIASWSTESFRLPSGLGRDWRWRGGRRRVRPG